jgi:hypothetical protein
MSDFVISQIRTYTPMVAGVVIAWLLAQGILDEETSKTMLINMTALLTGLFSGLYYFIVRILAGWKPAFGILLGVNKAPEYVSETE